MTATALALSTAGCESKSTVPEITLINSTDSTLSVSIDVRENNSSNKVFSDKLDLPPGNRKEYDDILNSGEDYIVEVDVDNEFNKESSLTAPSDELTGLEIEIMKNKIRFQKVAG